MKSMFRLELGIGLFLFAFGIHSAVARPWVPTDATNGTLVVWFDADDASTITESGGAVSQWSDKSGNGNHATNTVAGELPVYASSEIEFDGANDILKISNDPLNDLQLPTIFVVGRWDGWAYTTYDNNMVARPEVRLGGAFQDTIYFKSGTSQLLNSGNRPQPALTNDFIGVGFTESATIMRTRLNGVITESRTNRDNPIGFAGTNRSALGANCLADNWTSREKYYDGWLKEVVVVNEVDPDTVEKIEGYLAHKWGLEGNLDGGHPYKNEPPPEIPPSGTLVIIK